MLVQHVVGVMYHPKDEWRSLHLQQYSSAKCLFSYVAFLAAIPPLATYIGLTHQGFSLSPTVIIKLTSHSALPIMLAFYLALVAGTLVMAACIRWMQPTYQSTASWDECMVLTTFTAAPLFLAGLAALIPLLWVDILIGMAAVAYATYLLYAGVPVMMNIDEQRGFLFSSAIITAALVVLVGMLGTTIVLWSTLLGPVFHRGF